MRNNLNTQEYLFILKQDSPQTHDDLRSDVWLHEDNSIDLDWWEECMYDNKEVRILFGFREKLKYAYACWHNDAEIEDIIRKHLPEVTTINTPSCRSHSGNNLHEWCKQYNFNLEDFLTNNKYVVICDSGSAVENIINLGLFDWDNIEQSSVDEDNNCFVF